MAKNVCLFLCFFVIFPACLAAPPSPTDAYLAARDRYIAEFGAQPPSGAADKREDAAFADLEHRLRAIIPPWHAPGFPTEARINLSGTDDNEMGLSVLNGLNYEHNGTQVVVTTPALLRRWIPDHNKWWGGEDIIPLPVQAALRSDPFWTYVMFDDSAAQLYGEVPVTIPDGNGVVMLAAYAQIDVGDAGPGYMVAAVWRGEQVFVARQKLTVGTRALAVCDKPLREALAESEVDLKGYFASKETDAALFQRHVDLEELGNRDYRACFAAHISEQPNYAAIRKQAQALVDLLQ